MTSLLSAGNSVATQSVASSSGAASNNLGKYYMVTQGLSALMGVAGGSAGNSAAKSEAEALNAQADLALAESRREAEIKTRDVLTFREDQAQAYNSSGVLLEGSPMVVLSETIRRGDEEVKAIMKRGQATANLYRMKAAQARSAGSSSMFSSVLSNGANLGSSWIMGKKLGLFGNGSTPIGAATPLAPSASFNGYMGPIAPPGA